jgi:hypothetical protein
MSTQSGRLLVLVPNCLSIRSSGISGQVPGSVGSLQLVCNCATGLWSVVCGRTVTVTVTS